ncbi:NAD-glutamate dehydrogenase [Marinomonas posidonica]|uniref:NAD-glutamate dehydrogenase n=1 Tax=Marinomonas posidonica (strain CECT 7376 / NCIMB 14433 / IVIA-Po-181) TaxID=491952 RepID=F6CYT1_MARPP|nr:NAD-glutamate dehydrogenase [Marinomonas posidonica]AEF55763.1 NAD-glutamate dehydrogenase [Marinomonas posidonica IVIA-Po-181]
MTDHKKNELIERVELEINDHFGSADANDLIQLTRLYFQDSLTEDLANESIENLYGTIVCLWDFLKQKTPQKPKVRVYNPNYEEHSWQSTHTVIEILAEDMPFLVSSFNMALVRLGHTIHLTAHPAIPVERNKKGELQSINPTSKHFEALIRFEIDRLSDANLLDQIKDEIIKSLADVSKTVTDWPQMKAHMNEVIRESEQLPHLKGNKEHQEILDFLRWVENNHFTFIGFRAYDLTKEGNETHLKLVEGSGLGTFRDANDKKVKRDIVLQDNLASLAVDSSNILILTKSTAISTVHRPVHLDYLGIKRFDKNGKVIGEWRFFGLYSSAAYIARLQDIPLLRKKLDVIVEKANVDPNSHKGKNLKHILNSYPRDEMLQAPVEELFGTIESILAIQERRQLRVFLRKDIYGRFLNALVYVPRDRYNTELRIKMQDILMNACNGTSSEFNVQFSQLVLARVNFTIQIADPKQSPTIDAEDIQRKMQDAMSSWEDKLLSALHKSNGEESGNQLYTEYVPYLPAAYREDFSPNAAVLDIERLSQLADEGDISTHIYRQVGQAKNNYFFKVYGTGTTLILSDVLPILECMGLRVLEARPYELDQNGDGTANTWVVEFAISVDADVNLEKNTQREAFQDAFNQIFVRRVENDRFNALVLNASLTWRQVTMLRALTKYLMQLQLPFSLQYMQQTLEKNATIARLLVQLFEQRFDPSQTTKRDDKVQKLLEKIDLELDQVANLDEDRILKHYLSVIQAMLRTNFYQHNEQGEIKDYVSFKLDPSQIPAVPLPRPKFEIFVYAPWVEGVHMRGGKVARGGLRWSDRMEDFRTEVLGLVKAQMVKNAVIVPAGAKGGFVAKQLKKNASREEVQAEVVHCYTTFISGLLDITDNLVQNQVVPPSLVQRYDEDDPYLVVAADKGTATFSDLANSISEKYGFWLGDAFASGGSNGYDHKKMGITARGAWESVKRQFKEIGIDCQTTNFTAVGVGDMAGDVFGNGMLLSEHTCLIAAFNHLHIFIDPTPDAASSFAERDRLFKLPRSSWEDYNKELISKGGGIFSRTAKSIPINADIRKALGIEGNVKSMAPTDLINTILKAPVDLLWNGGIGTYVKAESESHADAGDSANNGLRVNGRELRCNIVGEGGNLGLTQLGRIEFAQKGGLISTDAIDNSAGVDSSDHEVNIKILLNRVVENGDMTEKQRNTLLAKMTDEVGDLVLRHNRGQSHVLSLINSRAPEKLTDHWRLIQSLVREGRLNREIEFLPTDGQIRKRLNKGQGLTRPEISVLLAYSKIKLSEQLVEDGIGEDADLMTQINQYFPTELTKRFGDQMASHPLAQEIIAGHVTNNLGNRMGASFSTYMQEETSASALNVVRAYMAAENIFGIPALWKAINGLDFVVPNAVLNGLLIRIQGLLERATLWLLRNTRESLSIQRLIASYKPGIDVISANIQAILTEPSQAHLTNIKAELTKEGIPEEMAETLSSMNYLFYGLDIIRVASNTESEVLDVAQTYFALEMDLELHWLRQRAAQLPAEDMWQRRAKAGLGDEVDNSLRTLTQEVIQSNPDIKALDQRLTSWKESNHDSIKHYRTTFSEIKVESELTLTMVTVAIRELRNLI